MMGEPRFRTALASEKEALAGLTFPAFRHLLDLEPQPRFDIPEHDSGRPIQPLAVVADVDGKVVGLVLAELPIGDEGEPEILSVFVLPFARRRGLGNALMARIAEVIADRGFSVVNAVYMTGKPEIALVEKIFWKQGWSPPFVRMTVVRFTADDLDNIPWMQWARVRKGYEAVLWSELNPGDIAALRESDENEEWIPPDLKPWNHVRGGFEPLTSMALKRDDQIVGWVLTHALSEKFLRYSCSYIRPNLGPRGLLLTLYRASLNRMRTTTSYALATLTAPAYHPQMAAFVKRHVAPWVSFVGETRGTRKELHRTPTTNSEDES
jgi:ribosomal protein S18 acetylase RimI-like enzyme